MIIYSEHSDNIHNLKFPLLKIDTSNILIIIDFQLLM